MAKLSKFSDLSQFEKHLRQPGAVAHNALDYFFLRGQHLTTSAGAADAGKPIVLNSSGLVDSSMLPSSSGSHAMLSATHTDTTVGTVQRGDLITGQGSSPTWQRLAKGSNTQVLTSDGTDIYWATPSSGVSTFLALSDAPDSYTGQTYKLVRVNASANALEFSSNLVGYVDSDWYIPVQATVYSSTSTHYPYVLLRKARGTEASPADVQASDYAGYINVQARVNGAWQYVGYHGYTVASVGATYPAGTYRVGVADGAGNVNDVLTVTSSYISVAGYGTGTYWQSTDGSIQTVLSYASGGSTRGVIGTITNHSLEIWTNSSARVYIGAGGNYVQVTPNLGIGGSVFGTSATYTFGVWTGTPPSSSPADMFQLYSADYAAGNAMPTFRTENGTIAQFGNLSGIVYSGGDVGFTLRASDTATGYSASLRLRRDRTSYTREWWIGVGINGATDPDFRLYDYSGSKTMFQVDGVNSAIYFTGATTVTGKFTANNSTGADASYTDSHRWDFTHNFTNAIGSSQEVPVAWINATWANQGLSITSGSYYASGFNLRHDCYSQFTNSGTGFVLVGYASELYLQAACTGTIASYTDFYAHGPDYKHASSTAVITDWYGFRVANPAANIVTNAYGLMIGNISTGSTLNYAIYVVGGTTYLGGIVYCGAELQAQDVFNHRNNIQVLNKAGSGWLTWVTRYTADAETCMHLNYLGTTIFNNAKAIKFRDSGGTDYDMLTLWSDNILYLGSRNTDMVFRTFVGGSSTEVGRWDVYRNLHIGTTTPGTNAAKCLVVGTGTAPSSSPADAFQMYSSDFAAGNAVPTFRTENGTVIQLNQSLTTTSEARFEYVSIGVAHSEDIYRIKIYNSVAQNTYIQLATSQNYEVGLEYTRSEGGGSYNVVWYNFVPASQTSLSWWTSGGYALWLTTTANLGVGQTAFGTSATKTIAVSTGTAPSSSPTDAFQMYSYDFTAGNACPYFRTENGTVIGLNQSLLTTAAPTFAGVLWSELGSAPSTPSSGYGRVYLLDTGILYFVNDGGTHYNLCVPTVSAHATSHQSGGSDSIKLDDFATPDDNADLNATTGRHGLLPKLGGGTTNFLRADGSWAAPPTGATAFTGLSDVPSSYSGHGYKVVRVNTGETALEFATLQGTSNRVTVSNASGTITLSAPQDIHTSATPQFAGLNIGVSVSESTLVQMTGTVNPSTDADCHGIDMYSLTLTPGTSYGAWLVEVAGTIVAGTGETLGSVYGIAQSGMTKSGSGTITAAYGIYSIGPSLATTNWNFYASGAVGNYFGGYIRNASYYEMAEISAPGTPSSGYGRLYGASDGKVYYVNDGGTTYDLTLGGGAVAAHNFLDSTYHNNTLTGTPVLGDLIHGNSTPAWARFAGNTTTTKKFLSQTGTGSASAVPVWDDIAQANVSGLTTSDTPQFTRLGLGTTASANSGILLTGTLGAGTAGCYGLNFSSLVLYPVAASLAYGLTVGFEVNTTNGVVTNVRGISVPALTMSGGYSITTLYGLYLAAQTVGGTNWSLYVAGGNSYISSNLGIGQSTFGTSAAGVVAIATGTAPGSSPADAFQMYSSDATAGNAVPTFRTENGTVIKLDQSLLTTDGPTFDHIHATNQVYLSTTHLLAAGGLNLGSTTFEGGITNVLQVKTGTAPSSSPTDSFILYSTDFAAGNAVPTFRTENGTIIKLNQSLTTTDAVTHTNLTATGYLDIAEQSAPATPSSGYGRIYFKTDGYLYAKNDGGTESQITGVSGSGGGKLKSQAFTSDGTWTQPTGVTLVWVTAVGGGGGGEAGITSTRGGGGGGGGAFYYRYPVTVSGNVTVTIGTSGSGGSGSSGANGGSGGNTTFGSYLTAHGGIGGGIAGSGYGGAGGGEVGFGATQTTAGGAGNAPTIRGSFYIPGAGGGGGTTGTGTGGAGGYQVRFAGGTGGNSTYGGGGGGGAMGAGGNGGTSGVAGTAASANTGAGGGGGYGGASYTAGGAGGTGWLLVEWVE